jgi:hypothetical protein
MKSTHFAILYDLLQGIKRTLNCRSEYWKCFGHSREHSECVNERSHWGLVSQVVLLSRVKKERVRPGAFGREHCRPCRALVILLHVRGREVDDCIRK